MDRLRQKDLEQLKTYAYLEWAGEDVESLLRAGYKRTKLVLIACGICLAAAYGVFLVRGLAGSRTLEDALLRPVYGEGNRREELALEVSYEGASYSALVEVQVPQQDLSLQEAEGLFDECEAWLLEEIRGKNASLEAVTGDLRFPAAGPEGRVAIDWQVSRGDLIGPGGALLPAVLQGPAAVSVYATLRTGDFTRTLAYEVRLDPSSISDPSFLLEREAEQVSGSLLEAGSDLYADLPAGETGGTALQWRIPKSSPPALFAALAFFLAMTAVFSRLDGAKRRLRGEEVSFEEELPEISLQLALLLNAGLVPSAAFEELTRNVRETSGPLLKAMKTILDQCRKTNTPFIYGLKLYASKTPCRQLVRFASIAESSMQRGSQLAEKLESEASLQWEERLSKARAKAAASETKLSFPLALLLLVMVIISVAPALLTV